MNLRVATPFTNCGNTAACEAWPGAVH